MNACVVHKYNNLFVLRVAISAKLVQGAMQEVIEHDMVGAALRYLRRYDTVLS